MRIVLSLTLVVAFGLTLPLTAQQGRGRGAAPSVTPAGPPKNLRVLPADANIPEVMGSFRAALGVQCTFCHVQGDFASDANAKKNMARNMLRIAGDLNAKFPDGNTHVTCFTCHRGEAVPKTEPPAPAAAPKPAAAPVP